MATSTVIQNVAQGIVATLSAGKNEAVAIELGGNARNLSVQVVRTAGTVQTGKIEVSNDGVNWSQAHDAQWVVSSGDGGNEELSGLGGAGAHTLHNILERARYYRLVVTNTTDGASDVVVATFFAA